MRYGNDSVWQHVAAGSGGQQAAGDKRLAAGGSSDDGDSDAHTVVVCGDVRLFTSCGASNVVRYPIFNFVFFVPGSLEMARKKKQD